MAKSKNELVETPGQVNAMALPYTGSQIVIPAEWQEEHRPGNCLTTMRLESDEDKVKAINFMLGNGTPIDLNCGKPFQVQDVLVHTKENVDERTGEKSIGLRICLIAPDGTYFTTGSPYVLADLNKISGFFRRLPWIPPLTLVGVKGMSRNNREFLSLAMVKG